VNGTVCTGMVFLTGGIVILAAIVFRWNWYMTNPRVQAIRETFGEAGVVIIHGFLGMVFVIGGVLMIMGIKIFQ